MRMVMLDTERRQCRLLRSRACFGGEVIDGDGGHQVRPHVEEPAIVGDPLLEGAQGLVVLQVPDMMAEEGMPFPGPGRRYS